MHDLAREVVALSEAGLKARARAGAGGLVPDETHFLNALKETIETGKTPADELLDATMATGTAISAGSTTNSY